MKHAEAVVAASAAAEAVYKLLAQNAPPGTWHRNLVAPANRELKLEDLVHFVEQHPGAPADALYRFGSGRAYAGRPWGADAALAAAVETFVAVFEKLVAHHLVRDAARPYAPRSGHLTERTVDRAPALRDREELGRRAPPAMPSLPAMPTPASDLTAQPRPAPAAQETASRPKLTLNKGKKK